MADLPIAFRPRDAEQGRIRVGKKVKGSNGKWRPARALGTIFTSHDIRALREIAQLYSGTNPVLWDQPGQRGVWITETPTNEIRVELPALDCLSGPTFEQWGGGRKLLRRCDGVTMEVGDDRLEQPCECMALGTMFCIPTLHLRVLLPDVRFGGVWRLTTHSVNAAKELPAQVEHIRTIAKVQYVAAVLAFEERTSPTDASKEYKIPVLRLDESIDQIVERALSPAGARPQGALGGSDDYEDADIIELPTPTSRAIAEILNKAAAVGLDEDQLQALVVVLSMGTVTAPWRTLTESRLRKISVTLDDFVAGHLTLVETDDGDWQLQHL